MNDRAEVDGQAQVNTETRQKRRRSLASRTGTFLACVLTISLVTSVGIVLVMTRSWMVWQLDAALQQDVQRLIDNSRGAEGILSESLTVDSGFLSAPLDEEKPNRQESTFREHLRPTPSEGNLYLIVSDAQIQAGLVQRFHLFALSTDDTEALTLLPPGPHPQDIDVPTLGHFRAIVHEANGVRYVSARGTGDITRIMMGSAGTALAILFIALLLATISVRRWGEKRTSTLGRSCRGGKDGRRRRPRQ